MEAIYLDNGATTRVVPEVAEVMQACLCEDYGNPSSAHRLGIAASARIKAARALLLAALGDEGGAAGELVFTSGGTEGDALGVLGAARARARKGRHLVTTAIEHPAVLGACAQLEAEGFTVTRVAPTPDGVVTPEALAAAVTPATVLIACMLVNNELGTIQPVAAMARAARAVAPDVHIHCDAVQGFGKLPIDARALGVDTLAISAHKLHGPKGVGALWIRKGTRLLPLFGGGGQQRGLRSGTENVPGIAALAEAARLAFLGLPEAPARLADLGARLVELVTDGIPGARQSCVAAPRVPHIVSLAFPGTPAEPLLHALEGRGIYVSAGSACASRDHGPSHVLRAIGMGDEAGVLRISFSRLTTRAEVETAARALVEEARALGVTARVRAR